MGVKEVDSGRVLIEARQQDFPVTENSSHLRQSRRKLRVGAIGLKLTSTLAAMAKVILESDCAGLISSLKFRDPF
jgi:hypothetical protein